MKINYWDKECTFYLGSIKINSLIFKENENISIVVFKKRTCCVISNPLIKYYLSPIKSDFFRKAILFKIKEEINIEDEKELKDYIKKSFNKDLLVKNFR